MANRLIEASSPYLLQHAHNPVDWYPWGEEALDKAKAENKPIIVSIGYSACHWCHVMERESFENEDIASIMNEHFVCIKVDREERPDVDQVYMEAVHAMGLQGGWPLNVFLLPDQRPFYGGTYFPPKGWAQLCIQIHRAFSQQYNELAKSADGFMNTLARSEVEKYGLIGQGQAFTKTAVHQMYQKFAENFDRQKGGNNRAPKFPMPVVYQFLLKEAHVNQNTEALTHVERTLDHMARGGIYDQVGGGFTRYSTDMDWFVPHFEKMLYDNGQLVSLYSQAYQATKKELYKEVVFQTIDWLEREMTSEEGGFYAALDADSEGEEGKFYLWTIEEFYDLLQMDAELMIDYYNLTAGNWEPGKNIPFRATSDEDFAKTHGLDIDELKDIVRIANRKLLNARNERVKPGLDDKILSGWNGLMLSGLCDAYATFGEEKFLLLALKNAQFIEQKMMDDGKRLFRNYKNGKAGINGYLEDYAAVIEGMAKLYQVSFDEHWLMLANTLTSITLSEFYDEKEGLFFYTSNRAEELIARKKEIFDNVIPSSNALMATNLKTLGHLLSHEEYTEAARDMVDRMNRVLMLAPQDLAQWATLYALHTYPTAEVVMVTNNLAQVQALHQQYEPNKVIAGKKPQATSGLALLKGREMINSATTYFVCYNKTCQLPVNNVEDVFAQMQQASKNASQ
ncbi:thioredoxin domain-containing protein [Roseivirga thermotolerans]|uniref:thioredoxin domain-containing protein n=1 Tax=Roseivirga thermotolerans TaxID=1758176 RepID=UPI00273EFB46|nr:thioredoxin domain-containing protein [Roseivirga thermotolerans]